MKKPSVFSFKEFAATKGCFANSKPELSGKEGVLNGNSC
jgi:hypothetical protein